MRLAQLDLVNRLVIARRRLLKDIDQLAAGKLRVTIDGEPQDDALLIDARPVVLAILESRLHSLDHELASMGVTVD